MAFPDPSCQPSQFCWFKMACTGVLHIVLHVLCPIRPSGNNFRPSKVSFSAIFAVLCDLFYMCFQKGPFPPTDLAENLCVEPRTPPGSKSKSWPMGNFWPKNLVKGRGVGHYYRFNEGSQQVQVQSQYHYQFDWVYKGRSSAFCNHINKSLCQTRAMKVSKSKARKNQGPCGFC